MTHAQPQKKSFFNMNVDLMHGPILKSLLLFMLPILVSNLFQQLYNTVDTMIVGNVLGDTALAAIGSCGSIYELLVGFGIGIGNGLAIVAARSYGAQDHDLLKKTVAGSLVIGLVASLCITLAGVLGLHPLLLMLDTPAEIMEGSVTYLQIYFMGVIALMIYNMGSGILRAIGDSRTPLYFLMVSSVVNIVLDLVFVINVQMGVAGVAWATLIAQVISAGLVLIRLITTKECYRLIPRDIRFHKHALLETIRIGLPGGIQNAVVSFSNLIVQYNINSFGAAAVAGCSAYTKIDGFAVLPVMSFSMAVTTFTGQNVGARNYERVKKGASTCLKLSLAVTVTLSVLLYAFGGNLLRVFSSDPEVLSYAVNMMHFLVPGYVCLSVAHTYAGVVRGAGISIVPMLALVGNMCVLRIIWLTLAMPVFHSIVVVYLGYTLTWFGSGLTMLIYYYKSHWLERQQLHDQL